MTFKVKSGINVGNRQILDSDAKYQQNLDVPSVEPTLFLDFVNQTVLDPRITFSRSSSATVTDNRGLVTAVANNVPRFNYDSRTEICDGLLIEESKTNLMPYSEQIFDTAGTGWSGIGSIRVEPYSAISPTGAMDASKLILASGSAFNSAAWGQNLTKPAVSNTYTFSVYMKPAGFDGARVLFRDSANSSNIVSGEYYVSTNTASSFVGGTFTNGSIIVDSLANGWYRISLTGTTSTETGTRVQVYTYNSTGSTGDGTSGVYYWGAQFEQGAFSTTYVPSTQTYTSRSTLASYQDSNDRLIKYAGVNQFLNTATFGTTGTGWFSTRASISYSSTMSPAGTQDAMQMTEDMQGATHEFNQSAISVTSGSPYTASVYAKANQRTRFRIGHNASYGAGNCFFDVSPGTAGSVVSYNGIFTGGTITHVGNNWFRCTATFIPTLTGTTDTLYYTLVQSGTTDSYVGDGVSGMFFWGPQVESGTTASLVSLTGGTASAAVRPLYNPATRVNAGTLVEPSATNLIYPSNIGSGWTYTGDTVINNAIAPDGTTTAATTTVPTSPLTAPYQIATVLSSTVYTASFYIKLGTLSAANYKFAVYDQTNSTWIQQNIVPTVTPVAYEWRRITYTFTTPATCTTIRLYEFRDPTGPATGGTIFTWGAQVELGYFASSLIPTTVSTATRAADTYTSATATRAKDVCVMTNLTPWFNNDQQSFVVSWKTYKDTAGVPHGLTTSSPAFANCTYLSASGAFVTLSNVRDGSGLSIATVSKTTLSDNVATLAYTMRQNFETLVADGLQSATVTPLDLKYVNNARMSIGHSPWADDNHLNCAMRYIKFYPTALSNTELFALTKYQ